MKRSEFKKSSERKWQHEPEGGDGVTRSMLVARDVAAAEAAGVTWDPEEEHLPVWGTDGIRLQVDGTWEVNWGGGWRALGEVGRPFRPVYAELSRRILLDRELGGDVTYWKAEAMSRARDGKSCHQELQRCAGKLRCAEASAAASMALLSRVTDLECALDSSRRLHDRALRRMAELSGIAAALIRSVPVVEALRNPKHAAAVAAYSRWVDEPE